MGAAASAKRGQRSSSLGALPPSSAPSSSPSSSSTALLPSSPSLSPLTNGTVTLRGVDLSSLNAATASELLKRIQALEQSNHEYKLELNLIYALDSIRDDYSDPASMF